MSPLVALLRAHSDLLWEGAERLRAGEIPDEPWQTRCQEVDVALRATPTEAWRAGLLADGGSELHADWRHASVEFESAAAAHREQLTIAWRSLRQGRLGMRGYRDAVGQIRGADGLCLDRRA